MLLMDGHRAVGSLWPCSVQRERYALRLGRKCPAGHSHVAFLDWRNPKGSRNPKRAKGYENTFAQRACGDGVPQSYVLQGSADPAAQDEAGSYRDDLQTVLDNAILIMLLPYKYLRGSWVPKRIVRVADAVRFFKAHMVTMLEDEISALRVNRPGSGGIISAFVRALDVHEGSRCSAYLEGEQGW